MDGEEIGAEKLTALTRRAATHWEHPCVWRAVATGWMYCTVLSELNAASNRLELVSTRRDSIRTQAHEVNPTRRDATRRDAREAALHFASLHRRRQWHRVGIGGVVSNAKDSERRACVRSAAEPDESSRVEASCDNCSVCVSRDVTLVQ